MSVEPQHVAPVPASDLCTPRSTLPGIAPLDAGEAARLQELEAAVDAYANAYQAAGKALAEIRDLEMYRPTHSTFEEYVEARWDFKRAHAYRLIEAAAVARACLQSGDIAPANEAQARELVKVYRDGGAEALANTWQAIRAEHGDQISAPKIREWVRGAAPVRSLTVSDLIKTLYEIDHPVSRRWVEYEWMLDAAAAGEVGLDRRMNLVRALQASAEKLAGYAEAIEASEGMAEWREHLREVEERNMGVLAEWREQRQHTAEIEVVEDAGF